MPSITVRERDTQRELQHIQFKSNQSEQGGGSKIGVQRGSLKEEVGADDTGHLVVRDLQ